MRSLTFSLSTLALATTIAACDDKTETPVSTFDPIELLEARVDATNTKDWDAWEALHTPDACRTAPEFEGPLCGADNMRLAIETLSVAFPDYHLELVEVIGDGERVVARYTTTGTMDGPLALDAETVIPATHRPIHQEWTAWVTFEDGRISAFDEVYDQYALLVQLGLAEPL